MQLFSFTCFYQLPALFSGAIQPKLALLGCDDELALEGKVNGQFFLALTLPLLKIKVNSGQSLKTL